MTVVFDANLGSFDATAAGTSSQSFLTTAAGAANARVVVIASYFNNGGQSISAVSVGGVACVQDKKTTNGSDFLDVWSCHHTAATTIGSSVAFTFTGSSGWGGFLAGAVSFTGILSTGALVTTASATSTGTAWSSGSATNTGASDALYVGGSGNEDPTAATTSTATNGTEIHDRYRTADQQGLVTGYQIVSSVAARAITGNWSNAASTANTGALAIYAGSGGGGVTVKNLAALGVG